ncbi:transcription cofactor vestigial-like protein 2 isoform X3 [Cavia porcellus]|uniref:transcription cofactor vestigial-like protein 2 isoform X3 n=1 Tax=Cavia porcellus TaxID=10141 RepID=UPI002FE0AD3E
MSCLEVMYQVYGTPQPYFAAAYAPYHQQKLAYYSKMQEAPECTTSPSSSGSGSSSFSSPTAMASIKEEEGSSEKERPPEAEYINSRCVLFTYFQGDISSVVDEHFSRALSQPSSYTPSCASKTPRSSGPWRDGPCPMSQRGLPASFWGGAYPATPLGAPLAAPPELPFAADPYAPTSGTEAWAPHAPYALGAAVHEVYAPRLDARFGPLLMPAGPARPRLGPAPRGPACGRPSRPEPPAGAWATPPAPFGGPPGDTGLGLGADAARRYSLCGAPLLS